MLVGSHNLTLGGTETNSESSISFEAKLPGEESLWAPFRAGWSSLAGHPNALKVTDALLDALMKDGLLFDESATRSGGGARLGKAWTTSNPGLFPLDSDCCPRPRPKAAAVHGAASTAAAGAPKKKSGTKLVSVPRALLMEIVPHHNGEVFLSKLAVNQHPAFFGFPFKGKTTPKKAGNPSYPQQTPDPLTDWVVYDKAGKASYAVSSFPLNTVYYETKSEIRT